MSGVAIRDLRQHLSRYLRRAAAGEHLVVTDRNRPVAVLGPLPASEDARARLVAEGRLVPGERAALDFSPVPLRGRARPGTRTLDEVRES